MLIVSFTLLLASRTQAEELAPRKVAFANRGTLAGFTGANQREKVTVCTNDGGALRCAMIRSEPDTPAGGCHAEAHLAKFPNGELFGPAAGFKRRIQYQVKFDTHCDAADVAFFQLKNNEGPQRWNYLVALWRQALSGGDRLILQVNPAGPSRLLYCRLSRDQRAALDAGTWHDVEVTGDFTKDVAGWMRVVLDGRELMWYRDRNCTRKVGAVVRGAALPDIPDSQWQLQLGGYGYFKDKDTQTAVDYIRDVRVETWN